MMKNYNTIVVDIQAYVANIWLNRPDVQNAVNTEMLDELMHCFGAIEKLENVRVIVLRGKGKSFSAGADLKRMLESGKLSFDDNLKDAKKWTECLSTIYHSKKPTIAVATGNVFGGGIGLLCASDIVISDSNAVFSFSEVKIGLAPSTILPFVLTRLNEHKAKILMFTGRKITAKEALEFNLTDVVVEPEVIESTLESILSDIVKASPKGVEEIKYLINEFKKGYNHEQISNITAKSIAKLKISEEALEGISAFMEKRLPAWLKE
ncbi:MAG TPA: enoyl-CoA hydratase [Bacteroidales bacterium]|nr:enoyl-CoA hydratase [Bacteroidales bacterium]